MGSVACEGEIAGAPEMSGFAVPFRKSIRFRLSMVIAVVIFAAVMTTSAVGAFRDLDQAADARAQSLEAAASAYSAALAKPLANRDRPEAFEHMKGMQRVDSVIFMSLLDNEGHTFAQLGAGASIRGRTADLRELSGFDLLNSDRGSVTLPVVKAGEQVGELVVLADITDLRADLYGTLAWTALVALLAIASGVSIAQVSISHMIRPIGNLAAAMSEVGARQDFTRRMPPSRRKDETAILGEAFNGMIDNIQERDAKIARHMETLEQTVEDRTRDYRLAKEEAEGANAAKSDFLATMSHEIRTPMNGMMVMAEMLASADLSVRHRRYAEIITRSGASLLTIINDILDLSKIEAGKLDLETVPFSPERIVEDVASLFWEKARSKGLELAIRIAPETPEQVLGDPTRLNQVITNLVNNALKFTDKGGVSVDLSASVAAGRAVLRIAVTDSGVGIEQHRIGAIFEAFGQADQSTTRRFGGTGLGLTVCKRLVDAMGGEIIVTSEIGKGSTFAVVVDFAVEQAAPVRPAVDGLRLAIAVSQPMLATSIATAARDLGIEARVITSPRQASAGETVVSLSDRLARSGGAPGAFNACLTDVGDNHADALIRSGRAHDLLPLPLGRTAFWEFAARAARRDFRGLAALASSSAVAPTETFGHLSILAVDDNAVNREVLREALLSLGAEGDFVVNGVEAVEATGRKSYDVIFMDGSMPEMDGFTATRLIREAEAKRGGRRAMIVALTAQVRGVDADAWAEAGADRHMTKPFNASRLVEALKTAGDVVGRPATIHVPAPPVPITPPAPEPEPVPLAVAESAQSPGAPSLLDEDAIETMRKVGARNGRDVVGKVWRLFLGQAPDAVFKLEVLSQGADPQAFAAQAHFLKSMALSAGASTVSGLAEEIEGACRVGRLLEAVEAVLRLRTALDETCQVMRERLDAPPQQAVSV
jgi:signal transduction histidine kinase/HPt (histidine-containing phosphotransfer) domain-containing protein/ActR/RegA family two-component response regulator